MCFKLDTYLGKHKSCYDLGIYIPDGSEKDCNISFDLQTFIPDKCFGEKCDVCTGTGCDDDKETYDDKETHDEKCGDAEVESEGGACDDWHCYSRCCDGFCDDNDDNENPIFDPRRFFMKKKPYYLDIPRQGNYKGLGIYCNKNGDMFINIHDIDTDTYYLEQYITSKILDDPMTIDSLYTRTNLNGYDNSVEKRLLAADNIAAPVFFDGGLSYSVLSADVLEEHDFHLATCAFFAGQLDTGPSGCDCLSVPSGPNAEAYGALFRSTRQADGGVGQGQRVCVQPKWFPVGYFTGDTPPKPPAEDFGSTAEVKPPMSFHTDGHLSPHYSYTGRTTRNEFFGIFHTSHSNVGSCDKENEYQWGTHIDVGGEYTDYKILRRWTLVKEDELFNVVPQNTAIKGMLPTKRMYMGAVDMGYKPEMPMFDGDIFMFEYGRNVWPYMKVLDVPPGCSSGTFSIVDLDSEHEIGVHEIADASLIYGSLIVLINIYDGAHTYCKVKLVPL